MFTEEQNELIESAAEMLYGLIHARYVLTSKGMAAMVSFLLVDWHSFCSLSSWRLALLVTSLELLQLDKYKNYDFGRCPRVYCSGQPCLPVGQSDIPRSSTVKIYCPRCEDLYYPRSKYQGSILISITLPFFCGGIWADALFLKFYYILGPLISSLLEFLSWVWP